jgi:hypothetical protein
MPKIKLGDKPKTFKPVALKFEMPDGSEGLMEVTYHYRTRSEYAQFITEQSKAKDGGDESKPVMERIVDGMIGGNVDFLIGCVDAWNLDIELEEDSLRQLADEVPAAIRAVAEGYSDACLQGRLGN